MSAKSGRGRRVPSSEKILQAAKRLLEEQGYEAFSLRAVARKARFAPSSLYEHFQDRQALLEELARRSLYELRDELAVVCEDQTVFAEERLINAAMAYLRFSTERPQEFRLCFSRPQPSDRVNPPVDSPLLPVIAEIARAIDAGECFAPDLDPLEMALALWTQIHGIAVLRLDYLSQTPDFDERARRIVRATIQPWFAPR